MIETLFDVIRGEGMASAARRARARLEETIRLRRLLRAEAEGAFKASVLNVCAWPPSERFGGVPVQLTARLEQERLRRNAALLYPGAMELYGRRTSAVPMPTFLPEGIPDRHEPFERVVSDALARINAQAVHFEGLALLPLGSVLALADAGVRVILSVHDFALFCARPNLLEEPTGAFCSWSTDDQRCGRCLRQTWLVPFESQRERRLAAQRLLNVADAVIFPSEFMHRRHVELFALRPDNAHVVEPAVLVSRVEGSPTRNRIAFVGGIDRHKGGLLMPDIIDSVGDRDVEWHVFGGGDLDILRAIRSRRSVRIHGWYRATDLPSLIARARIGLVVLPSIVPEAYGLTLSESWLAGVPVVTFSHGAMGKRVERSGGGWVVSPDQGSAGLSQLIRRWLGGELTTVVPDVRATQATSAESVLAIYESIGVLS